MNIEDMKLEGRIVNGGVGSCTTGFEMHMVFAYCKRLLDIP